MACAGDRGSSLGSCAAMEEQGVVLETLRRWGSVAGKASRSLDPAWDLGARARRGIGETAAAQGRYEEGEARGWRVERCGGRGFGFVQGDGRR